ncbi:alpha/beta hydrolase [Ornithinimicrobium cryptoxanthini]|uniref:Alpha/beta fold hydrolase n=1 Tax=Ornithinimicrobium cryptoxanthini TaxID=2934161 RepID=A0ABY4YLG8_9MICO|nr:alpha/beta fold hydrolase [Ornithinimicrobium cryptoxanthini]USQ77566.1 alpha/beta fold hydrolase [Ornithinimicrobium cryptoxanthini]
MQILEGAEPFHSPGSGQRADTAVLVMHGMTSSPQMVRPVADRIAEQGYAVSAPLLPGHGTTWQEMSRTRYADWLAAVVAALEELRASHRTVVAFGVSMGASLVTDVAARRPELIDGLVLVNPAFAADDWRLKVIPLVKHVVPAIQGIGDDIRREGPPREMAYALTPLKAFDSFVEQWPRLVRELPEIRQPVMLVRSRHDSVVPAVSCDVFLAEVGSDDVTVTWLEESAHVAPLDHDAEQLIEGTLEFVNRVSGHGT